MRSPIHFSLTWLAGLLLSSICCAGETALPPIDGPAYTQAQTLVQIEPGRHLNLYCTGAGSPTVVFEAGQGSTLVVWGYVQPAIAKKVRTCSYDRAGMGFSDGARRPSTSANIVDDLHRMLVAANIKPPYVLVGHSLGGMFVRLYADTYPADVVGMVLVDPAVEDQTEAFRSLDLQHRSVEQWYATVTALDIEQARQCAAAAKAGTLRGSDLLEKCTTEHWPQLSDAAYAVLHENEIKPASRDADLSETENQFSISADQVRASRRPYGAMPLAVLTRGKWPPAKAGATPEELANAEARHLKWKQLHDDVAKLSTRGSNEVVDGARHYIMFDKPQAVIDAIERVLLQAASRDRSPAE